MCTNLKYMHTQKKHFSKIYIYQLVYTAYHFNKNCSKCVTHIKSLNPHKYLMKNELLLAPLYMRKLRHDSIK